MIRLKKLNLSGHEPHDGHDREIHAKLENKSVLEAGEC